MKKSIPPIVYFLRAYYSLFGLLFPSLAAKSLIKLFSTPRKKIIRKEEKTFLERAKRTTYTVAETELSVYQWGEGEKLAMLFHGWESNAGSLGAFIDPLIERGYRVISFDAPAHGLSKGKHANLIYFKAAAKAIINEFGIPEIAIGHSLGADSIIMTALEENISFEHTILISPLNRLMNVFEEMKGLLLLSDSLFERFISKFEKQTDYSFRDFHFHNYGRKGPLNKVLLMHDKADKITNFSHAEEMSANWQNVVLEPIVGSGHYRILWKKEVIKNALEFIKN